MKVTLYILLAIILALMALFLIMTAQAQLEWVHGTHGGEKCYLKGTEHGNIKYPSEPFKSYTACWESLQKLP